MLDRKVMEAAARRCRVAPRRKLDLARHPSDWLPTAPRSADHKAEIKDSAEDLLRESRGQLEKAQEKLWADDRFALLLILQGMDAAGKDGIVKHVMDGVNPLGCHVSAFKAPSAEELDHDFLWRCARQLPERGRIGIFNRSYYEEVLVVRVHPGYLEAQKLPPAPAGAALWPERYRSIRDFERHLTVNGTIVRKFFLNVGFEEQRQRLLERVEEREKFWKFNPGDTAERAHWPAYQAAYAEALAATSTAEAPWYVIPADHKWFARALVAHIVCETVAALPLAWPAPDAEARAAMAEVRKTLEAPAAKPRKAAGRKKQD